jgi:hypothetical protein
MSEPGANFVQLLVISLVAAVILFPVLVDILSLFGVKFFFKPFPRFAVQKPDAVSRFRFYTGILSLFVVASWLLSLGWLRILFGLFMVIHFIGFRLVSWFHLRARANPADKLLLSGWATFCLGYFLLPDFGDTQDSQVAFFGLIRHGTFFGELLAIASVLLAANLVLLIVLVVKTRKKPAQP